jgi:hypothetical protein
MNEITFLRKHYSAKQHKDQQRRIFFHALKLAINEPKGKLVIGDWEKQLLITGFPITDAVFFCVRDSSEKPGVCVEILKGLCWFVRL